LSNTGGTITGSILMGATVSTVSPALTLRIIETASG
jgi:hypothetical protein